MGKDDWCHSRLTEEQRDMFSLLSSADANTNTAGQDEQERRLGGSGDAMSMETAEHPYPNPDFNLDPCRYVRFPFLSYITMEECDVCRRLLTAVVLGGAIG